MSSEDFDLESSMKCEIDETSWMKEEVVEDTRENKLLENNKTVWLQTEEPIKKEVSDDNTQEINIKQESIDDSLLSQTNDKTIDIACGVKQDTEAKLHKCNVCKRYFAHSNSLEAHKRRHTGNVPFKCDFCNKVFAFSYNLTKHELNHTGEKPFQCNICYNRCTSSDELRRHMLCHGGQYPYRCEVCNERFKEVKSYHDHIRQLRCLRSVTV